MKIQSDTAFISVWYVLKIITYQRFRCDLVCAPKLLYLNISYFCNRIRGGKCLTFYVDTDDAVVDIDDAVVDIDDDYITGM